LADEERKMGWGWDWYPKPKPRRPANGIKAQSKKFGQTWWASKWLTALERLVDAARLGRGRSYARSGQVLNLDITPGRVASRVQGSRPSPYKVQIEIKPLSGKEWDKVADAMASQAIFAAKLLSGEMPQDIEEAFKQAGVNLFPASRGDLKTECSCPDWANPCKHIAAVYYLLGEQFDADPFLIFRLRGKSKDDIMAMLRARRSSPAPSSVEPKRGATVKAEIEAEPAASLEECLARYWDMAASLDNFQAVIKAPQVDAAPVKRLGSPGFWRNSKVDFVATLTCAYQSVTEASLAVARGDEERR
jgi:uncharacterized Zn finger protein